MVKVKKFQSFISKSPQASAVSWLRPKAGTEVVLCGKLQPGYERNDGTPGIPEGSGKNTADKLAIMFCIARSLTVPN